MKYRKKPVVIDAHQLGDPFDLMRWREQFNGASEWEFRDGYLLIPTLEGVMRAEFGDFIIRGVKGEFYPCKPDIFAATYEPVEAK